MPLTIRFKDAVTGGNLDANATHAVYYADGRFANRAEVAHQCPHAKLYAITVFGLTGHGIFACDSETGDMTVAQTLHWLDEQCKLGVKPLAAYANENRWLNEGLLSGVEALERKYGRHIERWDAHYDNIPTLPPWADAKQYADPGPVDLNIAVANFFGDAKPADPPAVHEWSAEIQVTVPHGSHGVLHFAGTVDLNSGQWHAVGADGSAKWSGPGGGKWRIKGIPLDSKPLGK